MSDPIHSLCTNITGNESGPNYVLRIRRHYKQVAQISQRDCAAGWVSFGQKWKTGIRRQYFTDII